jgi:hypothetical protein
MWELDCRIAEPLERESAASLEQTPAATWIGRTEETNLDKVLHAAVDQQGLQFVVTAREWCCNSQSLSAVVTRKTSDPRELAGIISDALTAAFRPIGMIEGGEGEKLEFRMRAGEFPPPDESLLPFQEGQYLVPYMRYLGRKRELLRVQSFPWTFLKVVERDRSRVRVDLTSAFKQPLSGPRRRVEIMAILTRPQAEASEIRIFPRSSPATPLVGYRCDIVTRLPTTEDPVPDRDRYYTNRDGIIRVPVPEGDPLRFLIVHSGQSILARLPLLPGVAPKLDVEVPNDRARLGVEGEVALLQSELIDIVATREVLFARTRAASKKQDWTSVDRFMQQLEQLPTLNQFQSRIDTLQLQAIYQAQQAKDRAAENRIKTLCETVTESAQKHLDPGRIAEFRGEMRAVRR